MDVVNDVPFCIFHSSPIYGDTFSAHLNGLRRPCNNLLLWSKVPLSRSSRMISIVLGSCYVMVRFLRFPFIEVM